MKNELLMQVAIKAAVKAGKLLLDNYGERKEISKKQSFRDIVTNADKLAENEAISVLYDFDPEISIISEEQGRIVDSNKNKYWLIDALDGTVNFVNQIPFFSVSIAYIEDDVICASVIYVPFYDDLYFGARGVGVFKNHQPISVSNCNLENSLFAVSFSGKSFEPHSRRNEFLLFSEINDHSRGCLRTGSAALNLAFLAEGKLNGCWGKAAKYWDIAAGLLLVELAGCKISFKKEDVDLNIYTYFASGENLWDEAYPIINKTLKFD